MTDTGEVENPAADAPALDQLVVEAPAPEHPEKPVKVKKPRGPREKKLKVAHPPYFQMIEEALLGLDEKSGSSPYAIAKYMEEKHTAELPANFRKILALQLKNSAARGKLIKIKASYKLAQVAAKTSKVKTEKKSKQAKAAKMDGPKTRARAVKKLEVAKKAAKPAKKPKKSTPAKPKSIKSPAAKRAKKVAA